MLKENEVKIKKLLIDNFNQIDLDNQEFILQLEKKKK